MCMTTFGRPSVLMNDWRTDQWVWTYRNIYLYICSSTIFTSNIKCLDLSLDSTRVSRYFTITSTFFYSIFSITWLSSVTSTLWSISPPDPPSLLRTRWRRHIHEGGVIKQSAFGWLPDGWLIIAIIDTGCCERRYQGLMLLEFRSLTPRHHLAPWWIVFGKVVCADTRSLPLILCTLLALLRLLAAP